MHRAGWTCCFLTSLASLAHTQDAEVSGASGTRAHRSWRAEIHADLARAEHCFRPVASEAGVWSAPCRAHELRIRMSSHGLEVFPRAAGADGAGAE